MDTTQQRRLRRAAARRGMVVKKSRRRDPRALDFGTFYLVDADHNTLIAESDDLDALEQFLARGA